MTLEEKLEFINESKGKNYLFISPRIIQGGATLIGNFEELELYKKMDENTKRFAEEEIINLVSSADHNNEEAINYLNFNLIFCGNFDDLPNDMDNPIEFIMNNKEKIVAVYKFIKSSEQRDFFIGFNQSETIYNYGYLYLNLEKLLKEFEKNNVEYKIDNSIDSFTSSLYRDDAATKFIISYCSKKENESEKGPQLKKVRKDI